jgi:exonuclease III
MRLLAWNIRQGGGSRLPRIADALKHHDADIVVLSEYRGGPSAPRLCAALHALGYNHTTTLVPPPSCNGVLVAARRPFRGHGAVDMRLPEPYRMVSVDFATFRLVGIYMPNLRAKIPYWEALIATLSSPSANRALAIGDFNTCRGTVKLRRFSQNTGARTVVMPRWSRCAIAPPLLIGRSEASTGRRDGAGG